MKPPIKIMYEKFWHNFNPRKMPQDYFFEFVFSHGYTVEPALDWFPDVVIYSVFGSPDYKRRGEYNSTSNPMYVNYSCEPYNLGGDADIYLGYGPPNYYRLPLWIPFIIWDAHHGLNTEYILKDDPFIGQGCHHTPGFTVRQQNGGSDNPLFISNILKRHLTHKPKTKFCNFTYTNPVKTRMDFFHELNKYKFVHSTGSLLNNTGYRMISKSMELSDYKFTIAFENSVLPGYVTEKLMEPLAAGSVPIYFGDSSCMKDFNPKAFIHANEFKSYSELVEYIREVDNNDDLYYSYLSQPVFGENTEDVLSRPKRLFDKFYSELIKRRPDLKLENA